MNRMSTYYFSWIVLALCLWPLLPEPSTVLPANGIVVNDNFTTEALVQDIFVKGACRNISNIKSIGDEDGIGYFENGRDIMGIDRGIILSTGPIQNARGPNSSKERSGDFGDKRGDQDLRQLTSAPISDAVGIEFDFIPLDSVVTFRYVFASEEYCEFVGDIFNDVFGFFVSGPGISGPFSNNSRNVALVPGTEDYVSINTVNHETNAEFYIGNERREDAEACGLVYNEPADKDLIEYDGFTQVMTATLKVVPCETYKLRLAISDVSDAFYDSAVFLEAESFNIGGAVNLKAASMTGRDTLFEGCQTGYFTVNRLEPEQTENPISIGIRVDESSEAQIDQDFRALPSQVTIPAGQTSVQVPVDLIVDQEREDIESIVVQLDFPCACISDTARLYIQDPPLMQSGVDDQMICIGEAATLSCRPSGGVPGYTYAWSTGSREAEIRVKPDIDTRYQVTITDNCGRELVESVTVDLLDPPVMRVPTELQEVCVGDVAKFQIDFEGRPPYAFTYRVAQGPVRTVDNIFSPSYNLELAEEGELVITNFRDAICNGRVEGRARVRFYRVQALAESTPVTCFGDSDGRIDLKVVGGTKPYTFAWNRAVPGVQNPDSLAAGSYAVTISDAEGCSTQLETFVGEPPRLRPVEFNCNEFTSNLPLRIQASGGQPPYLYDINGNGYQSGLVFNSLDIGATYDLKIQDAAGCEIEQEFVMPVQYEKMVELPPAMDLDLGEQVELAPKLNIPISMVKEIQWVPTDFLDCSYCLRPTFTALRDGSITLQIRDVYGCQGAASSTIRLDRQTRIFVPSAFSPNNDGLNETLQIFADERQINRIVSFRIYNRWGALLYEQLDFAPNDESIGWDGRHRGQRLDAGIYVYDLVAAFNDGTEIGKQGSIQLMR